MRLLLRLGERARLPTAMKFGCERYFIPRPIAGYGLLLTAAIHLACGLDIGRYFHGDITDCALTR